MCRIGAAFADSGGTEVRDLLGERVDGFEAVRLSAALVWIDRGLETALNVGVLGVSLTEGRMRTEWAAGGTAEAVVQVNRGSRNRGNSATCREFAMEGI